MSIRESQGNLNRALEELLLHWDRTRDHWRDDRARQLETRVIEPLRGRVTAATSVMERMAGSLQRARRECSNLSGS